MIPTHQLPLVVVGAGPIGLAAAAHAVERGLPTVVLEQGEVGGAVLGWGHVRLFSPWSELVDPAARRLLEAAGWTAPDPDAVPDGRTWVREFLAPLARALVDAGVDLRTGARVEGVAREGRDLLVAGGREDVPFAVHVVTVAGHEETLRAAAVVDCSGTAGRPNPLGADGWPVPGERAHADAVIYAVPDVEDPAVIARLAGTHVVVAGAGASAQNALVALGRLATTHPGTRVTWLLRRGDTSRAFGGGEADELENRGRLGEAARSAAGSEVVTTVTGFRTAALEQADDGRLSLVSVDGTRVGDVDHVVAVTGFRPDHSWLEQVHLDLDPELGCPRGLAVEIHPAHHSCGTVAPHGAALLRQPEGALYLAGMKSYGRAPSFLALTGFEQVRSIVAEVAGDHEAAAAVELVLPETGVCGAAPAFDGAPAASCCGPSVPAGTPDLVQLGATRG
ncbi:NAD(P)-binding domain-containing protein [Nocardioides bruguierae]|uniref:NAD(P)/FAD-dependent oxidoreductase n=1 Tax=Nocardioides bruguierae TaxID=2945102 RepID=A0A9X2D5M5_9ACTN|nr:NAD(P)-binding domain-containing protein [Nocardioides bruguierae]MCM0618734.1 NAD(P)/FAD-dependent oxidoreductase [Nocardioides bruguierae]